jgi:hypothetical protein
MSGIPLPQSGLRAQTPRNLVLDAGVCYKNINLTHLRSGAPTAFSDAVNPANTWVDPNGVTVSPEKLGATKGGTAFDTGKKDRQVAFDSQRTYVKGMMRVDEIMPTLKTRLLETGDYVTIGMALGSFNEYNWGNYIEMVPKLIVEDTDYIGNVAIVAPVSGSDLPWVVVLENARVMNSQAFDLKDKDELAVEVTFTGSSLASNQYAIPCHVFSPANTGS